MYGKKAMALVLALAMMLSCGVSVFAAYDAEKYNFEYEMEYTGSSSKDKLDLYDLVEEELAYEFDWTNDVELDYAYFWTDDEDYEIYDEDLDYGYINSKEEYIIDLTEADEDDLYEAEELYENYIYYEAEDNDGYEYYGKIRIIIVDEGNYDYGLDEDLVYSMDYEDVLYLGYRVLLDVEALMDDYVDYIKFDLPTDAGDCGELYYEVSNGWEAFDDTLKYYADPTSSSLYDVEDVYFESNDEGGTYFLYYEATDDDGDKLEGTITINCGEALVVEVDIDKDEEYYFDVEDFQDAVDVWDDSYELVYIKKVELENDRDGTLYYDENSSVSTRTEYHVDDDDEKLLEDLSFVPASRASGEVIVYFDAYVESRTKDETLAGVLKINVGEASDIVVTAGVGDTVDIDWEVFQEYLEDTLNSTKYDVAYVTISGAPRSAEDGYLVTDGDKLTTRSDKTFYMDPSRTQYDLEDLQYQAGSKKGTHKATFKVFYDKSTTNTPNYVAATEGTIKFEVNATTTISTTTPMKASQIMSFAYELAAIKNMGGNDNVYIQFTTLPINGKLYYDFGTATQQDVTIGRDYYLAAQSGELQLSRVTYVPSYSNSKIIKYDTIGVKCFDKKDNGVKGSINIAIQHAQYSTQFTDVKDAKYADSVDYLYNQKITNGMTATTFGLTEKVTRGQFVTFLYRAAGSPVIDAATKAGNKFTDVKSADYYYNAVLWAVKNGITNGRSATIFDPTAPVTHQELLTFLYRYDVNYLGHSASLGSASYVYDYASVDSWAQNPVKWAVGKSVIDYGNLLPKDAGTRATVALWLHRMLTL